MSKKTKPGGSEFVRWFRPLIDCLHELGAVKPREAADWIAERERVPAEVRDAVYESGVLRFPHQIRFARQYLVWEGLIDDSTKGIWSLTPLGAKTRLTDEDARRIVAKRTKMYAASRVTGKKKVKKAPEKSANAPTEAIEIAAEELGEESSLLNVLRGLSATGFEHFCRHLLLAYGFERVTVTKRTGDEGIDGVGVLQLNPFVSSMVVFQCKRYRRSVGREDVSLLRSDSQQRADKAIFITTGTFTGPAKVEAVRVIPHIEMIDGEQLVAMCESKQIGLKPRTVYDIDHAFFTSFRD